MKVEVVKVQEVDVIALRDCFHCDIMLDELQRGMEDVAEIQNEDQSSTQNMHKSKDLKELFAETLQIHS